MPLTTALWSDEEEWSHVGSDLDLSDEDEFASAHRGENGSADVVDGHIGNEDHVDGVLGDEDSDAFDEEDEEEEIISSPELQSIKGTTNCQQAWTTRYH